MEKLRSDPSNPRKSSTLKKRETKGSETDEKEVKVRNVTGYSEESKTNRIQTQSQNLLQNPLQITGIYKHFSILSIYNSMFLT